MEVPVKKNIILVTLLSIGALSGSVAFAEDLKIDLDKQVIDSSKEVSKSDVKKEDSGEMKRPFHYVGRSEN